MSCPFEVHDPGCRALALPVATLERLWQGGRWCEGPVYFPLGDYVLNTRDAAGRLVTCEHGVSDGFRIDFDGNLWTSAGDGVHCYAPDSRLLGKIRVPEVVSNLTFGGPRRNRLFITATSSLYAIYVATNGLADR